MPSIDEGQGELNKSFFSKNSRPIMTTVFRFVQYAIFVIDTIALQFRPQQLSASVPAFNVNPLNFTILYCGSLQSNTSGPSTCNNVNCGYI